MEIAKSLFSSLNGGGLREMRDNLTWRSALINGFSPIPPITILLPIKIALFVILLIIFIAVGAKWWSIPLAYLGHALIVAGTAVYLVNYLTSFIGL